MSAITDPESHPEAVRAAIQAAVDATSSIYTEHAGTDVEQRLRIEMQDRGLKVVDEAWIVDVARRIRSGHDVRVGLPDEAQ
ncbi:MULTISPECIES: hypothetical protein [Nocardioides]|uniref:Uncharacterized protein n=1 Tax=Nocardioides vastitatis TaxID=2568655 RepID=A0ABW0ZD39_9ACTN|nr:hypothetical protein [Nocardioides sp.]THJ05313.1 hypothetical protein E7Z54_07445 [Nocardioides sp.]